MVSHLSHHHRRAWTFSSRRERALAKEELGESGKLKGQQEEGRVVGLRVIAAMSSNVFFRLDRLCPFSFSSQETSGVAQLQ